MRIKDIPLDITKTPQEILITKFNQINGLNLNFNDFVFEDPQPYAEPGKPYFNTSVKVVPKETSKFYNAFTIYYRRMDLAEILDNPYISIKRGMANDLYELIPQINACYNIYLTEDDYEDQALPPIDLDNPEEETPVLIQALPTSFLFIGSHTITLNKPARTQAIPDEDNATIFIVTNDPTNTQVIDKVIAKDLSGTEIDTFKFLKNCTVTKAQVDRLLVFGDNLIVIGGFNVKPNSAINGSTNDILSNCLRVSLTGNLLEDCNNKFAAFIDGMKHVKSPRDMCFALNPEVNAGLYKFNTDGTRDETFGIDVEYKLEYACIDNKGRIYTVSEMITRDEEPDGINATGPTPIKQYWIMRFEPNGERDDSFSIVTIKSTGNADPWKVGCIEPLQDDVNTTDTGIYIRLLPDTQSSSQTHTPIINGEALVKGDQPDRYGILPIIKIYDSGNLDTTFEQKRVNCTPEANTGELLSISGDDYYSTYRWTRASNMITLYNNTIITYGKCKLMDSSGTFLPAKDTVVSYNADTTPSTIIYQVPDLADNTPMIKGVCVYNAS